jgi:hypothetical protein
VEASKTRTSTSAEPVAEAQSYEQCGQCGAPVEATQRYCVVCGFHRRHVRDPVSRYLMTATSRTRSGSAARARRRRGAGLGAALLMAVIPIAVGVGVLVGRSSSSGDDKLIAALRAQKPEVVTTAGGGSPTSAGSFASTSLSSDFPLQDGYAVEIQTLPSGGTTHSALAGAEHSAESKGAPHVGVILQSDYRVTPAPPAGAIVIYSGAYKSRAAAVAALAKLSRSFPAAKVIQVRSAAESVAGGGRVIAHTHYGTVHQIVGFHATKTQLAQGAQVVNKIQQTQGKSYVDAQRGLPDQISVP